MVIPVELQDQKITSPRCFVFSFSSIGIPLERTLFVIALAQGFSGQGYRVLLIDLDFEVPLLTTSLVEAGVDLSSALFSNDWYTAEESLPIDELLEQLVSVSPNPLFPISVMPSSPDARKLKVTQEMSSKQTRKALRKMTRLFEKIQNEQIFDVLLVNIPYMTAHTINGMMVADYNFVMIDHEPLFFHLLNQYVDALVGIYPTLNIAGLILHRFHFSPAPENDAVVTTLIEDQLRYPIVAKLPSLRDQLLTHLKTQLWLTQDQQLQDFFESIALNFTTFAQTPRRVEKKKIKHEYYQLFIVHHSGIPLYRYTFKSDEVTKDEALTSAGLTSIIAGTEIMISEIVSRRESAKLIEMRGVKVLIEQWKDIRVILLANFYDESTRRRIKALVRHFARKYAVELGNFLGNIQPFETAGILVEEHLLQRVPPKEREVLPLFMIRGIGKSRAWELQKQGIFSINDLVKADADIVSSIMNVDVAVIEGWIAQGNNLLKRD
ncbi:MAG: AAA family ATPase [Promethearchaeota archaeon]